MRRTTLRAALGACALFAAAGTPALARAGEIHVAGSVGGAGTSWHGDGAGFGSLQLGYRFADVVAPYFLVRLGYGAVDERMLTLLSVGVQGWAHLGPLRPYARFGLVHQHEESMAAVKADTFGALFGVGDGIRHRFGFEGALGLDWPFYRKQRWEVFASIEGLVTGYPDPRGPSIYGGGGVGIGFHYGL